LLYFADAVRALGLKNAAKLHNSSSRNKYIAAMVVTEIILAKIYRFCQLSSHSRWFFARIWNLKSIGPSLWISLAHKTPSYDTNMLPKEVFDKTVFVKFKISNNFNQNIDEAQSKKPKITGKFIPAYGF
jgi:hypothetical protein